jgi:hypothetical protein
MYRTNPLKEYLGYFVIAIGVYPFASMFFDYIDLVGIIVTLGGK